MINTMNFKRLLIVFDKDLNEWAVSWERYIIEEDTGYLSIITTQSSSFPSLLVAGEFYNNEMGKEGGLSIVRL